MRILQMNKIIQTVVFVVVCTLILNSIPNQSNFPAYLIIPVIVGATTKYVIGDWDEGYQWSKSDILYWTTVVGVSAVTTKSVMLAY